MLFVLPYYTKLQLICNLRILDVYLFLPYTRYKKEVTYMAKSVIPPFKKAAMTTWVNGGSDGLIARGPQGGLRGYMKALNPMVRPADPMVTGVTVKKVLGQTEITLHVRNRNSIEVENTYEKLRRLTNGNSEGTGKDIADLFAGKQRNGREIHKPGFTTELQKLAKEQGGAVFFTLTDLGTVQCKFQGEEEENIDEDTNNTERW